MFMERIEAGMFARSKAGHDRGSLYLVYRVDEEYAYLIDGKRKTLQKPKKKNLKHIQIIRRIPEGWDPERISDDDVKRAIRQYERESGQFIS